MNLSELSISHKCGNDAELEQKEEEEEEEKDVEEEIRDKKLNQECRKLCKINSILQSCLTCLYL